ncbi:MAG: hypothetical protein RMN52_03275 [Anaerolineae bacterium]|nr:hypothetical protein [Candidatus Roseilinea sp.]MDW8449001.1 hypothetical protein [Anaerolineae bacterium]
MLDCAMRGNVTAQLLMNAPWAPKTTKNVPMNFGRSAAGEAG